MKIWEKAVQTAQQAAENLDKPARSWALEQLKTAVKTGRLQGCFREAEYAPAHAQAAADGFAECMNDEAVLPYRPLHAAKCCWVYLIPFDERGCGGEQMKQEKTLTIPLDKRVYLSLEEAMSYTGLDEKTLRKLSDGIYNSFVLWAGRRRLLKREMLEEYLENEVSAENEENQE